MLTRLLSIFAIAALAFFALSSPVFAASHSEAATYVDGNLSGITPNTGGTLTMSDEKAMVFRTGLATVNVPYSGVTHAELGAVKETSHALYKVWQLGKKTETQLLIVNFKDAQGEEKTMTLEVARGSAPGVLSSIQSHSPAGAVAASNAPADKPAKNVKTAKNESQPGEATKPDGSEKKEPKVDSMASGRPSTPKDPWWGDDYWKTPRNSSDWDQKASRPQLDKASQPQQQQQ